MMKAIGVIPARWASSRFPGKALTPLCGRPMIQWVVSRARLCGGLDSVVVATDDERIRECALETGVDVVMTGADHPSGTDRVAEAVASSDAGIVVNIQGDEPLLDPGLVDALVDALGSRDDWDMTTAACPISSPEEAASPNVCKVVFDRSSTALYFSRHCIPFVRDGADRSNDVTHWRHVGIYAYRKEFLIRMVQEPPCELEKAEKLEQLRAMHIGGRIGVVKTEELGVGVDTPEDVAAAENLIRRKGLADG